MSNERFLTEDSMKIIKNTKYFNFSRKDSQKPAEKPTSIIEKLKPNLKLDEKLITQSEYKLMKEMTNPVPLSTKSNKEKISFNNYQAKPLKSTTNKIIDINNIFKQTNTNTNFFKDKKNSKSEIPNPMTTKNQPVKMVQNNHFLINLSLNLFPGRHGIS